MNHWPIFVWIFLFWTFYDRESWYVAYYNWLLLLSIMCSMFIRVIALLTHLVCWPLKSFPILISYFPTFFKLFSYYLRPSICITFYIHRDILLYLEKYSTSLNFLGILNILFHNAPLLFSLMIVAWISTAAQMAVYSFHHFRTCRAIS